MDLRFRSALMLAAFCFIAIAQEPTTGDAEDRDLIRNFRHAVEEAEELGLAERRPAEDNDSIQVVFMTSLGVQVASMATVMVGQGMIASVWLRDEYYLSQYVRYRNIYLRNITIASDQMGNAVRHSRTASDYYRRHRDILNQASRKVYQAYGGYERAMERAETFLLYHRQYADASEQAARAAREYRALADAARRNGLASRTRFMNYSGAATRMAGQSLVSLGTVVAEFNALILVPMLFLSGGEAEEARTLRDPSRILNWNEDVRDFSRIRAVLDYQDGQVRQNIERSLVMLLAANALKRGQDEAQDWISTSRLELQYPEDEISAVYWRKSSDGTSPGSLGAVVYRYAVLAPGTIKGTALEVFEECDFQEGSSSLQYWGEWDGQDPSLRQMRTIASLDRNHRPIGISSADRETVTIEICGHRETLELLLMGGESSATLSLSWSVGKDRYESNASVSAVPSARRN